MTKYIVHSNSICHVTHLLEIEAESEDEALNAFWDDGQGELIGIQVHDTISFPDPAPDTASEQIQGIFYPVKETE